MKNAIIAAACLALLGACRQRTDKETELQQRETDLQHKEQELQQRQRSLDSLQGALAGHSMFDTSVNARFFNKNNNLYLKVNSKDFLIVKDYGGHELQKISENRSKGELTSCAAYGASGTTCWTATIEDNKDIKVEQSIQYPSDTDKSELRRIKHIEY